MKATGFSCCLLVIIPKESPNNREKMNPIIVRKILRSVINLRKIFFGKSRELVVMLSNSHRNGCSCYYELITFANFNDKFSFLEHSKFNFQFV